MKLLALLACAAGAFAQPAPSAIPKIKFTDTRLDNGRRVLISEDHYAPVYAIAVACSPATSRASCQAGV